MPAPVAKSLAVPMGMIAMAVEGGAFCLISAPASYTQKPTLGFPSLLQFMYLILAGAARLIDSD